MIEFNFVTEESSRFGEIHLPIIPVKLIGPEGKINTFMYLDSGADISLISYSIGKEIGLKDNRENIYEIGGIGGTIPYILSKVRLRFDNIEISVRIGWVLIEEVPFILGRLDIFNKFSIEFREFENKIIMKESSEYT